MTENFLHILDQISDKSIFTQPAIQDELANFENALHVISPEDLKTFITKFGAVRTRSEYNLFGLGCHTSASPSLLWAKKWLSFLDPSFPQNLLPVGTVDWNIYACLELEPPGKVIRWEGGKIAERQSREVIANSYAEFVLKISKELLILDQALITLRERVEESEEKYHYDLGGKGKLPRNQDFRVHRFCSRDIILGVMALKHQKGINCLKVDLFLPINIPPFERDGSLIFMTLFMLGDAYRCGGTMEIRFTENVDGGQVPRKLQALAKSVGAEIKPESLKNRKLDPDDSTRLYLALTGFSNQVCEHLTHRNISPLKACFVVHRGIWSKAEVEMILLTSADPNRIFNGGAFPSDWCNYQMDLIYSRSAVLSGFLARALARRKTVEQEQGQLDVEDNTNDISSGILPEHQAFVFQVHPPQEVDHEIVTLPWLIKDSSTIHQVDPEQPFIVLVRCRKGAEFQNAFDQDLETAAFLQKEKNCPVFILVPRDFNDLQLDTMRPGWIAKALAQNTGIIVCGEDVSALEEEVLRRWRLSKLVRE